MIHAGSQAKRNEAHAVNRPRYLERHRLSRSVSFGRRIERMRDTGHSNAVRYVLLLYNRSRIRELFWDITKAGYG